MTNYRTLIQEGFFGNESPQALLERFGSPLYVYNEDILRRSCRDMRGLIRGVPFQADYSVKANGNLSLLRIIRQEGLHGDAMSPGEIQLLLDAGYAPEEILFVPNNVDDDEFRFAIERDVLVSVDSLSQLERFGRLHSGGNVAVRFNPGVGAGHHQKVVTAGKAVKFGVSAEYIQQVKELCSRYRLRLVGINQHIGSCFMTGDEFQAAIRALLALSEQFDGLEFVDFGGGFGVPYHKQEGQARLDLDALGAALSDTLRRWCERTGRLPVFRIEPGRYVVCESGALLGRVQAIKHNEDIKYVGTDIGFNVLMRPVMYDSYHDIEVYSDTPSDATEAVTMVGNICENGDILAMQRLLPAMSEGDIVAVRDAGAYGYSQSSPYNMRLRPAEVLISNGQARLIRRRDTYAQLSAGFQGLE